jgi:hypothetical protein
MPLFAMPLPDGCVGCMMRGPLHKVDDLCVVPFTRSLSAEGSALFVRILIAITPRMYGEVLALSIHRRRPDVEVLLAPPGSLDGEIEHFGPHVLMQDAKDPVALLGLPDGILCRVRMLTTERWTPRSRWTGRSQKSTTSSSRIYSGCWRRPRGCPKGTELG